MNDGQWAMGRNALSPTVYYLLSFAIVMLLFTGCGQTPVDNEAPLRVVKEFVAAVEEQDASKLISLLEPAEWRREVSPEIRSYMAYVEQITFRDPTYEVVANDGKNAQVRLRSTVVYELRDIEPGEYAFDTLFDLVKIEEEWYLQSLSLPQPGN